MCLPPYLLYCRTLVQSSIGDYPFSLLFFLLLFCDSLWPCRVFLVFFGKFLWLCPIFLGFLGNFLWPCCVFLFVLQLFVTLLCFSFLFCNFLWPCCVFLGSSLLHSVLGLTAVHWPKTCQPWCLPACLISWNTFWQRIHLLIPNCTDAFPLKQLFSQSQLLS